MYGSCGDTLSLHDALPISASPSPAGRRRRRAAAAAGNSSRRAAAALHWSSAAAASAAPRSEEHTSELQSRRDLVCRLLLEKKNKSLDTLKGKIISVTFRRV